MGLTAETKKPDISWQTLTCEEIFWGLCQGIKPVSHFGDEMRRNEHSRSSTIGKEVKLSQLST